MFVLVQVWQRFWFRWRKYGKKSRQKNNRLGIKNDESERWRARTILMNVQSRMNNNTNISIHLGNFPTATAMAVEGKLRILRINCHTLRSQQNRMLDFFLSSPLVLVFSFSVKHAYLVLFIFTSNETWSKQTIIIRGAREQTRRQTNERSSSII